jgi:hypothetical protein
LFPHISQLLVDALRLRLLSLLSDSILANVSWLLALLFNCCLRSHLEQLAQGCGPSDIVIDSSLSRDSILQFVPAINPSDFELTTSNFFVTIGQLMENRSIRRFLHCSNTRGPVRAIL